MRWVVRPGELGGEPEPGGHGPGCNGALRKPLRPGTRIASPSSFEEAVVVVEEQEEEGLCGGRRDGADGGSGC